MKKRRTLKYWIGQIHLWLGLASGLVVLIVSLTGCLFVFQQEIDEALHHDRYFVQPSTASVPLSTLKATAQAAIGADRPIAYITTFRDPARSWEFMSYKENDSAITYLGSMEYYESVFVDPHTGVVTGKRDYKYDFFFIVKAIHWSLLLNTPYGQPIVGWSTVVFVIGLITGIVLWWPKKWNKAWRDRSFKINWKASYKRVNYDLHNVPGFYSLFPALIIAFTGLVWVFGWFSSVAPAPVVKKSDTTVQTATTDPLQKALQTASIKVPDAPRLSLSPAYGKDGVVYINAYPDQQTYYGYDVLQFDQYTGTLLHHRRNAEKKRAEKLVEMNYDIHVGAIGGLTGKVIAFIASLVCASLPVTGFLVWWWKKKKKPARARQSAKITAEAMV
ncbi:MAG: PepSY domain-containing protein [Bacteroidetes bacterium]|nr:PepSY domain-containing protein [Bacteroidota bacterium]